MNATVLRLDPVRPNPAHALDGGIPRLFHIMRHFSAASDVHRSPKDALEPVAGWEPKEHHI